LAPQVSLLTSSKLTSQLLTSGSMLTSQLVTALTALTALLTFQLLTSALSDQTLQQSHNIWKNIVY
jgi:hypothetical protein